ELRLLSRFERSAAGPTPAAGSVLCRSEAPCRCYEPRGILMNRTVTLFNTLGRQEMAFEPIEPGRVRLYTCGPTVYNFAHIGNLRTYIFEDTLRRVLVAAGYEVD